MIQFTDDNLEKLGLKNITVNGVPYTVDMKASRKCRKCDAEIWFVKTSKGRMMPVDFKEGRKNEWESHFANCPASNYFRRQRKKDLKKSDG